MTTTENQIELDLIAKLGDLKYAYRPDIHDRATLESNFREKFQQLNRVNLTDEEYRVESVVLPTGIGVFNPGFLAFPRSAGVEARFTF